jgi:hypothetical protein
MKQNQKAWLLTWEWIGDHAVVEDHIAGILRPRLSWQVVGEIVEHMYAVHAYNVAELTHWSRPPKTILIKHNGRTTTAFMATIRRFMRIMFIL